MASLRGNTIGTRVRERYKIPFTRVYYIREIQNSDHTTPLLWGIGLDPLKVWQVVMPRWHVDPPELAHYSARGDAPIEKWPGQPVTTEKIMQATGDPRDWYRYGHRLRAAEGVASSCSTSSYSPTAPRQVARTPHLRPPSSGACGPRGLPGRARQLAIHPGGIGTLAVPVAETPSGAAAP